MKIKFDRTAFQNETSVLTNFEKKYEVSEDTRVSDLVTKFVNQHLTLEGISKDIDNWRIIAVKNMAYRELAVIENGQCTWINQPEETISNFWGVVDPVTVLAMHQKNTLPKNSPELKLGESTSEDSTNLNLKWQLITLPIRVETKARQLLAFTSGFIALASITLLIWQYQISKAIMTEAIIAAIVFGFGCYYLLLIGRRIIFWTKTVIYRNRYNQYEKFKVSQFEHIEWMDHSEKVKYVFRYEEKGRHFITAMTEKYLDLIIWAISNNIPIYSTDSDHKRK